MTDIPVIDRQVTYVCNGGETVLDIDWPVDSAADVAVVRERAAALLTLTFGTDYALEGLGDPRGARVILLAAALAGDVYDIDGGDPVEGGDTSSGVTFVLARYQGDWALSTTYARGDAVVDGGTSYVALVAHTSTAITRPGTGSSWQIYWGVIAERGADGPAGPQGPAGPAATVDADSVDADALNSSIVDILADAAPPAAVYPRAWRDWIATVADTGTLDQPLAAGPVGRRDWANTVTVTLSAGALATITEDALLDGGNVIAVQNAGGGWEVLQFQTATLVSGTTYQLTGLLRGQGGTAAEMGAPAGAAVRVQT